MKLDKKKDILKRIARSAKKIDWYTRLTVHIYEKKSDYLNCENAKSRFCSSDEGGERLMGELCDRCSFGWCISEIIISDYGKFGVPIGDMVIILNKDFGEMNITSDFIEWMKNTMDRLHREYPNK